MRGHAPTEDLEDAAVLAGARRRLALALDEPSRRADALLARLTSPGGGAWAEEVLARTVGTPEAVPDRVTAHLGTLRAAAADEHEAEARFLVACTLTAAYAVAYGAPPRAEAGDAAATADELLDVASELPEAWSDLLAAGVRALRGSDEPAVPPAADPVERIGGYRLLEPLGRGSFGTVYHAIQPGLNRPVALKVLRPDVLSSQAEARFLEEGRILSSLSHPGIAAIYQAGLAQHLGMRLPFLAMELVRGRSLQRYAVDLDLACGALVELVVQACDALGHAHERGVVHRDVHPGNLLVRDDGTLKVVDFGAALTSAQARPTHAVPLGAFAYLAPEQARAEADRPTADVRSDVFGLGAVLFELLCGEPPRVLAGCTPAEALERVRTEPVRRLRDVDARLDPDLDAICARALAFEPDARYATARAMAADLRRYVLGLPVDARPLGFLRSTALLARRHARATAAIGLVALGVALLGVTSAIGWRRASVQAAALVDAHATNEALVADLLALALEQADKAGASWDSGRFYEEWSGRTDLHVESPRARAHLLELLARHAMDQRRTDDAVALRREAVQALRGRLTADDLDPDERDAYLADLSVALVRLGDSSWHALGLAGRLAEDSDEVERVASETRALFHQALELDQQLVRRSPEPRRLDDLFWSHLRLFDLELRRERTDAAWAHVEQAVYVVEALLELDDGRPHTHYAQAELLRRLHACALTAGDLRVAGWLARESRRQAERAVEAEPERVPFGVALAQSERALERLGLRQVPAPATPGAPPSPTDLRPRRLAVTLVGWSAWRLSRAGDGAAAARSYRQAAALFRACVDAAPEELRWLDELQLARYLRRAGRTSADAGDADRAEAFLAEAAELEARVRARGVDPELAAAADGLIAHPHASDPCAVAERLRAQVPAPGSAAAHARLLRMAELACGW